MISPLSLTVLPAILGLTAATILAVSVCFCARRIRKNNKKANANPETALTFQPPRRPTAVRSPSGAQPQHYLKKSPSPTSAKSPPGAQQLPQDVQQHVGASAHHHHHHQQHQQQPPHHNVVRYTEERESGGNPKYQTSSDVKPVLVERHLENGGNGGPAVTGNGSEDTENGKLGSLVFKLRYLNDRTALVVSVVRCRGLPGRNALTSSGQTISNPDDLPVNGKLTQNATDPYVKLQLLPDKQHKVKTR